jgi:hypothetical protein
MHQRAALLPHKPVYQPPAGTIRKNRAAHQRVALRRQTPAYQEQLA